MARNAALYSITTGLSGCYMPDSTSGPMVFGYRAELAAYIRYEIEFQEFPASCFAQVKLRKLWSFIRRNGSSVAHFSITHNGREIAFHGLTEDEFNAAQED